ncbi:MAG: serine/threonine-protein phosphatase [Actinobacteria bacterium]|jgi:PPM family protein phosphatase|uniref:PP2C family protein-serine/threonine phosphatase n=1 Tax=Microbacterium TaxID=33882 RepID=UPI000E051A7B|nr:MULTISPECIES: PP2C family serine/threonine-protein phosphatase [Microbacterium]MEC8762728.1 PP2C family serine/threonine-protein phosphatase [Actinomycetota bacterium]RCL91812.1 MAG: serine/threonine-protein phosphatase [Microbacterium sp.]MCC4268715.1 protein phosphatase 2C domain-containing protein [Microbacterium schleiferi]RUA25424.1 MAG: serine/threonine-protein phosphatase [Actinomycetota bacterium]HAM11996.1 serine/threonine-protein phosphatase [Microbacterium sp.]|tara:strand:+ start:2982 stop:4226 length:1245 start_codon:yes stop_codon:yes gene_type:complete
MVFEGSSAALSHTGKVRSNNQDSGYAGSNLFVVADGMGGHAGGDVASSIAIAQLAELDRPFDSPAAAERALGEAITDTAAALIDTVAARPELAGMGTTVSALAMVDDYAVIAHIGDSRVYLYRDGALTQITTDHTFVQRLVDSGRITPEEARYHPRRSVLMRVLGDMSPNPEIDTFVMPTQPGDRWLLCSDGLCGVVPDTQTSKALAADLAPARTADALLKMALDAGAPDNVTIVLVDVGGRHPLFSGTATVVGSASNPEGIDVPAARSSLTGWLHPARQAANEPTHFEPAPEFLEELIEEDRRRSRRRRLAWIAGFVIVLAMIGVALFGAYQWTQTRFFVGADDDTVVIYRGIQQNIGPISLSTPYEDTGILLADLSNFKRATVEGTISARSLADARAIVNALDPDDAEESDG